MTDRPIIFSAPMVRALLDGRKTQTRRVLKWQPPEGYTTLLGPEFYTSVAVDKYFDEVEGPEVFGVYTDDGEWGVAVPYQPGDRLWVRETWENSIGSPDEVSYRATAHDDGWEPKEVDAARWTPSIHMPRWASRLTLIVEAVRVERLQSISEADAMAEGAVWSNGGRNWFVPGVDSRYGTIPDKTYDSARDAFRALWESINGAGAWVENPWIVAVQFRVVHANIDAVTP